MGEAFERKKLRLFQFKGEFLMLDFRMKTFLTVCRCMNYTRASEELHITQPAVSQHIRFLEKHYQTKLFRYEGKKLCLTDAGEALRGAALTMQQNEQALQNQMLHAEKGGKELSFGVTMMTAELFMAEAMERYLESCPDTRLHMKAGEPQELLTWLDQGELDFVITDGYFERNEYEALTYCKEKMIAVCSPDYPIVGKSCKVEDLLEERLLIGEKESGVRVLLEQMLELRNLSIDDFTRTAEIAGLHTMKELTKAGCGITFLYETAVRKELESGELKQIRLRDFPITHDISFLWKKGSINEKRYREVYQVFCRGQKK